MAKINKWVDEERRRVGRRNWTEIVDQALRRLDGLSAREARLLYGFGRETLTDWRRKRAQGKPVLAVRGFNQRALERLMGDAVRGSVPLSESTIPERSADNMGCSGRVT